MKGGERLVRIFSYITVGRILHDLWEEAKAAGVSEDKLYKLKAGKKVPKYPIERRTLLAVIERLNLPSERRTHGKLKWRVYTEDAARLVKNKVKKEFNILQT